jgi:hypothetical protein
MQTHQEFRHSTVALGDFSVGGVIGLASSTVDAVAAISIAQSTASQILSLPTPSDTAHSLLTQINNVGTTAFVMHGTTIDAKSSAFFVFTNGLWHSLAVKNTDLYRDGGKPNVIMTGGGVIKLSAAFELSWSNRLIVLGGGASTNGSVYSANGYYDITMPPVGTVIPALGNAAPVTVTTAGISMTAWGGLYYKLSGAGNASVASNFVYVGYAGGNYAVTPDMVLVAASNRDSNYVKLGTGEFILTNTILGDLPDIRRGGTVQAGAVAGGVIPIGYSVYADANANWNATITLPASANRVGDIFTVDHRASLDAAIQVTNTTMAMPFTVNASNKGATFSWNGSKWDLLSQAVSASASAGISFVGASTGNPSVTLGNFIFRYNTATTNIEIATVSGTETITSYNETRWANGAFDTTSTSIVVNTTFQPIGDLGLLTSGEKRDYWFSPVAPSDTRAFKFSMLFFTGKIAMNLANF